MLNRMRVLSRSHENVFKCEGARDFGTKIVLSLLMRSNNMVFQNVSFDCADCGTVSNQFKPLFR